MAVSHHVIKLLSDAINEKKTQIEWGERIIDEYNNGANTKKAEVMKLQIQLLELQAALKSLETECPST